MWPASRRAAFGRRPPPSRRLRRLPALGLSGDVRRLRARGALFDGWSASAAFGTAGSQLEDAAPERLLRRQFLRRGEGACRALRRRFVDRRFRLAGAELMDENYPFRPVGPYEPRQGGRSGWCARPACRMRWLGRSIRRSRAGDGMIDDSFAFVDSGRSASSERLEPRAACLRRGSRARDRRDGDETRPRRRGVRPRTTTRSPFARFRDSRRSNRGPASPGARSPARDRACRGIRFRGSRRDLLRGQARRRLHRHRLLGWPGSRHGGMCRESTA